jgi:predicted nucleotidyltransferase
MVAQVPIPNDRLAAFCQRWKVAELSLFGSVLRDDFAPSSDVDVLVRFAPGVMHDAQADSDMQTELESIFGRRVDLIESDLLTNPFRRHEIFKTKRIIYAA